ncbi:hypothetical protein CVT26_015567 [Gymnopilus dilepis]|uniref:Argonaute-like protein n=1 Tax=Gymnopilus dilepis TaxID=231916 RepID=A0A409XYS0_9AGAR|nr:hypothetical protein CVT26_015567 [Gymnopilus dilepis]
MPPRSALGRGTGPHGRGGGPSRGGGAGRGGVPVANVAASVRTVGVKRPGYGQGGRPVNTLINAFAADVTDGIIYHYDAITPEKLPARLNMQLYQKLQEQVPALRGVVYDGKKNAFSMIKLPLGPTDGGQFDVILQQQSSSAGARPPKIYKVKLTKVAEINTELLHRFIAGQQSQDNTVLTSIMALNVVIRMQPNLKYPFNTRSFFTPTNKKHIGSGIELWRGYFQSLRPGQNKLYVNVDISTGMFYKDGPLLQVCLEYLGRPNQSPDLLSPRKGFPDRERVRLQRFVSGMRVITVHGGKERGYVIKRLTPEGASTRMFKDREGKTTSVAQYFQTVLGKRLQHPDVICVEVGSGAAIPLELCRVPPGQIMCKALPSDKTNDMLEFSKLQPPQRLASIRQGLQVLQYGQSEYIRQFGMNISETPMVVRARVLPPPVLKYGDGSAQKTIKPSNGSWNMIDKKFFKPMTIQQWIIVIYESERRFPRPQAEDLAAGFCKGAASVGMKVVEHQPLIFYENGQGIIGDQLRKAGKACVDVKKHVPTLIVVVLPEGGNQIYTAVKHFGDVTMGVVTQCLKSSKCGRAKPQYWANVMLKVNVKLGGINSVLGETNVALNDPAHPTIVMGADVNHPAPGAEGRPSFATLVSSVDSTTAKYISESRVQTGRVEMIEDLENMCKAALIKYQGYQNAFERGKPPPSRLIFYRDGVSEGQFQQLLDDDFSSPVLSPCRMFPQAAGDADRSGNCQAGTTIDEGIGHPTEFDYYQLTHGGLLGTSRPAHYSVIYDENKFSADTMQSLSFALCHVYARATRSVSIPAPVYCAYLMSGLATSSHPRLPEIDADIVCSRAKNHYAPGSDLDLSETATQVSNADNQLQAFRAGYKPLHANMANMMYFMTGTTTTNSPTVRFFRSLLTNAPRRGPGPRGGGPGRGGGAGRGGTRVVNIAESVETIGVRRPGFGTGGRQVQTIVNAFPVDIPDEMIYHYDAITPDRLPARMNMQLYGRLQQMVPAFRTAVYDTKKNIYSIDELPLGPTDSAQFDVTLEQEGPPSERPPKIFKIKVTKAAEINTELLHRFIAGQQTLDNPVFTAIMAFNVVIRMRPNEKHPFNVRSFFTPQGKRAIGRGIELWHGYFQSVRPTQGRMYINLDIATGIMYKDGRLIDLCLDFFGKPNPNILSIKAGLPDRERLRLQRFLSGVRVITSHGGRKRAYVVKKITAEGASARTFTTREGQTLTVANYFRTLLGRPLQFPDNICVEVGSGAVIPLELCDVPPGQIMRKQIPQDKTSDVVDFARLRPDQRLNTIRDGLQYGQSQYIRQFGMSVTEQPITVTARVLDAPVLRYGDGSRQNTISIKQWIIVIYESQGRFPLVDAQDMATAFRDGANSVGMTIEEPRPLIFYENGQGNIGEQLRAAGKKCFDDKKTPPDVIVVVLPEGGNQIYTAVKHFGDVTMGVVTQCLKSRKCKGAKMQYWANVMLKLNAKLGGINNILQASTALRDPNNPTIVMGADVIHPAPGTEGRPSFTTLVGSIDDTTALYTAESRVQTGRVEVIEDLQEMCQAVIRTYASYQRRKGPPTRLIFYRGTTRII